MTYTWRFRTSGQVLNPVGRQCYKGPMIDVEVVMSRMFQHMSSFEFLRASLLDVIVTSKYLPESTRETTLRAMNSLLSPVFGRLLPRKQEIQVLICTKRHCTEIEEDLEGISPLYLTAAQSLPQMGVLKEQVELIISALKSESPLVRVAGKSALILLASYIEMDYING